MTIMLMSMCIHSLAGTSRVNIVQATLTKTGLSGMRRQDEWNENTRLEEGVRISCYPVYLGEIRTRRALMIPSPLGEKDRACPGPRSGNEGSVFNLPLTLILTPEGGGNLGCFNRGKLLSILRGVIVSAPLVP